MFGMSVVSELVAALRNRTSRSKRVRVPPEMTLLGQRGDERLLPLDPADVAAVADAVADPHVGERLLAVQGPGAGRNGDAVLRAVDVLGHADLDAVDGIHHVLEAAEVDDDVVVDAHPGGLLELLHRAGGAADGEGGVPDRVGGARDGVAVLVDAVGTVYQGVARDGDAVRRLPVGREVEQERGVGPAAGFAGRCRSRRSHGSRSPSPGCSGAASGPELDLSGPVRRAGRRRRRR